jgi:hypothetical protein
MFSSTKNSLNKVFAGDEHRRPPIKKGPLIVDLQEEKEAEEADSSTGMWTVCPVCFFHALKINIESIF